MSDYYLRVLRTYTKYFVDMAKELPELQAMVNCHKGQGDVYHPEGDVATHTAMVIVDSEQFKEQLSKEEYQVLLMGCLFHDVGKPLQKIGDGDHAEIGYHLVKKILKRPMFSYLTRVQKGKIADIVKDHSLIFKIKRNMNSLVLKKLAKEDYTDMLLLVDHCDTTGRHVTEQAKQYGLNIIAEARTIITKIRACTK